MVSATALATLLFLAPVLALMPNATLAGLIALANNPRVDELRRKRGTNVFRPVSPEQPDARRCPAC